MEFPKIKEVMLPKEWATDDTLAELVIYEKIIENYVKVMLVCGVLLMLAVVF